METFANGLPDALGDLWLRLGRIDHDAAAGLGRRQLAIGFPQRLVEARRFGLEPIGPAHHNLYLSEGFYDRDDLVPFAHPDWDFPPNYLSTHYFVSRAFEPGLTKGRPFKRNSMVQRFLSMAFPPAVGNFAPLMIHAFQRK